MRRARPTLLLLATLLALAGLLVAPPAGAAKGGGGGKPTTTTTTTTSTSSTTSTTVPGAGRDPILFVHGWNSSGSVWSTMAGRFQADGHRPEELSVWSYDTSQSNEVTAEQIALRVEQLRVATGAATVDVIAHSMGSLSSRWYLKSLGGGAAVDAWVSLGGPNHGTDTAYWCFSAACREMRPGSSFLDELNAGDESPGDVRYATWWSPCDSVINPDSSVAVSGAANTQTACLGHSDLHQDATVYGQVRSFID